MTLGLAHWGWTVAWLFVGSPPNEPAPVVTSSMPDAMRCFVAAYPDVVCGGDANSLHLCDGRRLPWDDGRDKSRFTTLLNSADLQDTVTMRYRPGRFFSTPAKNFEPGRIRHEPFFEALYGATKKAVRANLVRVPWMRASGGRSVLMTTVNGVDRALKRVSDDLEAELPMALRRLVAHTSGTFNWRKVRGKSRRSMHSFGIAIDVGIKRADYWDWNKPGPGGTYRFKNRFPVEVAEIFERHGFIWGGKWYHFDTMHFEYRPEFFQPGCALPRLSEPPPDQAPYPKVDARGRLK